MNLVNIFTEYVNIFNEYVNIYLWDARGKFIVHIFA